jgi:putative molybdopterin biosynthesis protein
MHLHFLTNTALDEAIQKYQDVLIGHGLRYRTEIIDTQNTLNRVSAIAVYARISAPHYNACGMDGIALDSKKTFGATETTRSSWALPIFCGSTRAIHCR